MKITKRAGDFPEFFKNWRWIAVFFDFLKHPSNSWRRDDSLRAEQVKKQLYFSINFENFQKHSFPS
jgi:hypothetical protein